jgi:hypothetical protein
LFVDVIALVEVDVDGPTQRGILDNGAPQQPAREPLTTEDVGMQEPPEDLKTTADVVGRRRPVPHLMVLLH